MSKKYETLVEWVKDKIITREYKYGDKLMSEYEFCEMFEVSRQVVRRAIDVLREEKLVNSQRGSGTYVCCKLPEVKKKTNTIAFVTGSLNRYIYPRFLEEMQKYLSVHGYNMQLFLSQQFQTKTEENLKNIMENNLVDGIVISPQRTALPDPNFYLYKKLEESKFPSLFFNSFFPNLSIPYVGLDDYKVGYAATEYLCKVGHTKIACLVELEDYQAHLRYAGYYDALKHYNIVFNVENLIWFDCLDFRDYEMFEPKLYHRIQNCTAIFCYNDMMAVRVFDMCKKYGIKVPDELSIVSVDNTDLAEFNEVKLTSVSHPVEDMGQTVAKQILSLIDGESIESIRFEPKIIERDSVMNRNIMKRIRGSAGF